MRLMLGLALALLASPVLVEAHGAGKEILMQLVQSRRDFLASLFAVVATGILRARTALADDGTPTIRLFGPFKPSTSSRAPTGASSTRSNVS